MKLRVDHDADALCLRLNDAKVVESGQVAPGVIMDFDSENRVVGLEVRKVSQRVPKPRRSTTHVKTAALVREKPSKKYGT